MSSIKEPPAPRPTGTYRLLHTADWHLGKTLNDRSREEEHRLFLEWLLTTVVERQVDAIVLTGDLFDTANPSSASLQLYYDFVSRLHRSGTCDLVVIAGNHDSAAQLEAPREVLHALNVHVAGFLREDPRDRIVLLPRDSGEDSRPPPRVALALIPFLRDRDLRIGQAGEGTGEIRRRILEGIGRRYRETADILPEMLPPGPLPVIATGHLTVTGSAASDSEREIHIGGLGAVPPDLFPPEFSYVALGHLHRPQKAGTDRIRYSGSPIPLSFSEVGDRKEVRLLDIRGESLRQTGIPVPLFRSLLRLRTTPARLEDDLLELLERQEETPEGEPSLPPWIEVTVAGTSDDLNERAHRTLQGRRGEILRVIREHSGSGSAFSLEGISDAEAIDTLVENPHRLFEHLLERDATLGKEEQAALKTLFTHLVEMDASREHRP
ncbi:MAG: exonuclease subunit SbcD [Spirochaetaceae bacterium]|nr:MAG: exonuclease subunit SbcD [Spirochaetaceae bacterium]